MLKIIEVRYDIFTELRFVLYMEIIVTGEQNIYQYQATYILCVIMKILFSNSYEIEKHPASSLHQRPDS